MKSRTYHLTSHFAEENGPFVSVQLFLNTKTKAVEATSFEQLAAEADTFGQAMADAEQHGTVVWITSARNERKASGFDRWNHGRGEKLYVPKVAAAPFTEPFMLSAGVNIDAVAVANETA
jgi:hypothetical protein